MFCNACGKELQPGQQYCGACGQPVGVGPIPRSVNRFAHHIQVLGALWIAYSALHLLASIALLIVAMTVFGPHGPVQDMPHPGPEFLHVLLTGIGFLLLLSASLGIAAGVGLLQRQRWARVLAIVLGVFVLFNFPFGTALGVYTLWTLFSPESQTEYESMVRR